MSFLMYFFLHSCMHIFLLEKNLKIIHN
jgi:hypothetical protein